MTCDRLTPLYLTDADVDALAPPPGAVADAIAAGFLERARGMAAAPAKTAMNCPGSDLYCQAMPAAIAGVGAGVKWVALSPGNAAKGLPHISATMILAEPETGVLTGIFEAGRLTALRTAAMSLLAARYLARPGAAVLALIGCGVQARAHLEALRSEFPLKKSTSWGGAGLPPKHSCGSTVIRCPASRSRKAPAPHWATRTSSSARCRRSKDSLHSSMRGSCQQAQAL